ncbi:MAG: D-alanine--D-alanine ligase [Clostridia bacterium]|nr:D-alanine--D-alanine ligase [Clostridia bacterium]
MNIVVLAGGLSPERDVSFSSGTMATNALLSLGHRAVMVDLFFGVPDWDGTDSIFENARPLAPYAIGDREPDLDAIRAQRKDGYNEYIGLNVPALCQRADIVYMALHGDCGENGKLQALFDSLGIRYTGSGAKACADAMDKWVSKAIFEKAGVLCPKGVLLRKGDAIDLDALPLPCCVKPCCGGSSIGVSIVQDRSELPAALDAAFAVEPEVLVEQYIHGRELSCAMIGDLVLPIIEIIPKEGFYDYKNKYQAGATEEITPAHVDPVHTAYIQRQTEKGFHALHLSVYGRLDFLLTEDGEAYCLEANTLPGLTPTSLMPQEAAAAGISYEELCARIVALSLEKYHG